MPTVTVGHLTYDPEALAAICRQYGIQELALFGSVLREDFDPARSDVDVLVTFLPDSPVVSLFDVFHAAARQLERETGLPWQAEDLPPDSGTVTAQGRALPLAPILAPLLAATARQIAGAVQAVLGPAYDRAAGVILAGGGALALAPHWPGRATLAPQPQWANAQGFLAALES